MLKEPMAKVRARSAKCEERMSGARMILVGAAKILPTDCLRKPSSETRKHAATLKFNACRCSAQQNGPVSYSFARISDG